MGSERTTGALNLGSSILYLSLITAENALILPMYIRSLWTFQPDIERNRINPTFHQRKKTLLVNFRVKHPVRDIVCQNFFPAISNILMLDEFIENLETYPDNSYHYLQWVQTGRRNDLNFYKRLINLTACACFGGVFIPVGPQTQLARLRL